jgi:hypothetical protein
MSRRTGKRAQRSKSAACSPASRGRMIERETTSDKPSGDSPRACCSPSRCPVSTSSTKARPARVTRSARARETCKTTFPVQQGQPAAKGCRFGPASPGGAKLAKPSQSLLWAHTRAIKAVFPVRGPPVTICNGIRAVPSSAFLTPAYRQAKGLELPVEVGSLETGTIGHARHASVLARELV